MRLDIALVDRARAILPFQNNVCQRKALVDVSEPVLLVTGDVGGPAAVVAGPVLVKDWRVLSHSRFDVGHSGQGLVLDLYQGQG